MIRAPRSILAQASLLSLDDGVKLFEEAGKLVELVSTYGDQDSPQSMLIPLAASAKRSFHQSGLPTGDEDLALIGRKSRASTSSTKRIEPDLAAFAPGSDTAPVDDPLDVPLLDASFSMQDGGEWYTSRSPLEVDFDAFLATFGIGSSTDQPSMAQPDFANAWGLTGGLG